MSYSLETLEACSVQSLPIDCSPSYPLGSAAFLACLTEDDLLLYHEEGSYLLANWRSGHVTPFFGCLRYAEHFFNTSLIKVRRINYSYESFLYRLDFLRNFYTGSFFHRALPKRRVAFAIFQSTLALLPPRERYTPFFSGYGVIRYSVSRFFRLFPKPYIPDMTIYIPTLEGMTNQPFEFNVPDPMKDKITFAPFVYRSLPSGFAYFSGTSYPWLPYKDTSISYPTAPLPQYFVQSPHLQAVPYLSLGISYVTQDDRRMQAVFCASPVVRDAYLLDLASVQDQLPNLMARPVAGVLWLTRTHTYLYLARFLEELSERGTVGFCKSLYRIEFPPLPIPSEHEEATECFW